MLTPFDDYPIHQTPAPIAQPVSADPNHYDRYWFNGYERDGRFFVGAPWVTTRTAASAHTSRPD